MMRNLKNGNAKSPVCNTSSNIYLIEMNTIKYLKKSIYNRL